ncbi:MAG: hypothetical protein Q8830_03245, partial [Candidatus Phytoplasma australasiaticum]|nr:hypothetical protein [Candidatus Phytoplasma australasiaticum]
LGAKVALIEKHKVGGVCLNYGCIPTKAFLKSAKVWDLCKNAINIYHKLICKYKLGLKLEHLRHSKEARIDFLLANK